MNRIVLIGNGFDLAHGLKTSYFDFLNWYWDQRFYDLSKQYKSASSDTLGSIELIPSSEYTNWNLFFNFNKNIYHLSGNEKYLFFKSNNSICKISLSTLFSNICHSVETKCWVDIENEYFRLVKSYAIDSHMNEDEIHSAIDGLNDEMSFLQKKLTEYLQGLSSINSSTIASIKEKIFESINPNDLTSLSRKAFVDEISDELIRRENSKKGKAHNLRSILKKENRLEKDSHKRSLMMQLLNSEIETGLTRPDTTLLISFNYTETVLHYIDDTDAAYSVFIHGQLKDPEKMIFGYGDELDLKYRELQEKNDNVILDRIKSIRYLETDNYRGVLRFVETAPFQIYIMGHSCGNSDRTLLNTLFEHKNCASIKPFYYIKNDGTDNYLELVQNISRNFTDMKLFRDRVVNKTYCTTIK